MIVSFAFLILICKKYLIVIQLSGVMFSFIYFYNFKIINIGNCEYEEYFSIVVFVFSIILFEIFVECWYFNGIIFGFLFFVLFQFSIFCLGFYLQRKVNCKMLGYFYKM